MELQAVLGSGMMVSQVSALSSSSFLIFPWSPGVPAGLCMYPFLPSTEGCAAWCRLLVEGCELSSLRWDGSHEPAACPLGRTVFSRTCLSTWLCAPALFVLLVGIGLMSVCCGGSMEGMLRFTGTSRASGASSATY